MLEFSVHSKANGVEVRFSPEQPEPRFVTILASDGTEVFKSLLLPGAFQAIDFDVIRFAMRDDDEQIQIRRLIAFFVGLLAGVIARDEVGSKIP